MLPLPTSKKKVLKQRTSEAKEWQLVGSELSSNSQIIDFTGILYHVSIDG